MQLYDPCEQYGAGPSWGKFIPHPQPLPEGTNPTEKIGKKFHPVRQNRSTNTENKIWNEINKRIIEYKFPVSDLCSEKHYFDVFEFLRSNNGLIDRVAECGTFQGGLSVLLAGCALAFDFKLDLIEINTEFLEQTYHRIRLTFPEALDRVNLFHGEIPNYVQHAQQNKDFNNIVIHHDGSHAFPTVFRDLASLYYIKDKVHALLIQDTHMRHTDPNQLNFVDAAVNTVFGFDPYYQPIGMTHQETTQPSNEGIYFLGGRSEGMLIPIAMNQFFYPHPNQPLESLIKYPSKP